MGPIRRAAVTGLLAAWLAPLPAAADSQSSNSSSNCSDGRCSRLESLVIEDDRGRRGWVREDRWRERDARSRRDDDDDDDRRRRPRRRDRDDDDDDD